MPTTDSAMVYSMMTTASNVVAGTVACKTLIYEGPPDSIAAALRLPQSKQWGAEAGCYVTSCLHTSNIGTENGEPLGLFLTDNTSTPQQALCSNITFINPPAIGGSTFVPVIQALKISEFDLCGAFFTGLTPQTVLTINWNVVVERFPSNDDLDLVVLANPSPELDDIAVKFYSHAIKELPTGVPVAMNGFGDWFKDVVSTASDYIAPVLSAIPHPATQALGMGLKVANAGLNPKTAPQGAAGMMSPYQSVSAASAVKSVVRQETAARNANIKAKNALVRAKNEEIRARKAAKGKKK